MNIVLWAAALIMVALFLPAGLLKLFSPYEKIVNGPWPWAGDFSPLTIKAAGTLEVLACIGLVVPPLVNIAPWLAPLAAVGLICMMTGAFYTHIRREEHHLLLINAPLLVLAIVVAWGRFGPYAFA